VKVLISHPTGNSFFRAASEGLARADMLAGVGTTVATFPGNTFDKLSSIGPFAEFRRRQYNPILQPYTQTWPLHELGRMAAAKAGFKKFTRHETGLFSVDAVYRNLDKQIANKLKKNRPDAVYAYEDGALYTFRAAKQLGIKCIYDLPIGYWHSARSLLGKELERWPDWAATLTNFKDSESKLANKDEELSLADVIFVASSFTASTLKDFPGKLGPVEVIPYGFPQVVERRDYRTIGNSPLKLLFVGGLSQRKGIADMFAAVEALGNKVELTVVGHKATSDCTALNEALTRHKWIPSLPHSEILKVMRGHDVLIFPSLFEGFGLVITEAMSQGTPVITTDRTAGPDLIRHDENGWLVQAGSTTALKDAIERLLLKPEIIKEIGSEAMQTARLRPWTVYGQEFARACLKYEK